MQVTVSKKRILGVMLSIVVLLVAAHILSQYYLRYADYPPGSTFGAVLYKLDLNAEMALGSWYSQAGLLACGVLLGLIGFIKSKTDKQYVYHWYALATIFVYLSFDEATSIHEQAVEPVRRMLGIEGGLLYFAWIIPAMALFSFVALFFVQFWLRLPRGTRYLFVLSAVIFLAGSVGVEMIGAARYAADISSPT